jgi:hypothetical protein
MGELSASPTFEFIYNKENDYYLCPSGGILSRAGNLQPERITRDQQSIVRCSNSYKIKDISISGRL